MERWGTSGNKANTNLNGVHVNWSVTFLDYAVKIIFIEEGKTDEAYFLGVKKLKTTKQTQIWTGFM